MNFLLIFGGLILLILGGNWLLKSAVALSLKLEIPKIIIGMTVVSLATSAPELIVSINAALNNSSYLALGNVIGSNVANLGFVLGVTLLFGKIEVQHGFYKVDWPIMIIASSLLFFFLKSGKVITQIEGIILFTFLVLFLIYLLKFQKKAVIDEMPESISPGIRYFPEASITVIVLVVIEESTFLITPFSIRTSPTNEDPYREWSN